LITYLYWAAVVGLAVALLFLVGMKMGSRKAALAVAGAVLVVGWAAYYFHFQQMFVKRWGGVMTISVPEGQHHIAATWKDDNLWVENYDPKSNTCIFTEYSRGNLLQGRVLIKDCNPLALWLGTGGPDTADVAPTTRNAVEKESTTLPNASSAATAVKE
jgi:hypothetical protein